MTADGALRRLLALLFSEADHHVRWHLSMALAVAAGSGLLAALAPVAMKMMIDTLSSGANLTEALAAGVAYLCAFCGARLLADFGPFLSGVADQRLERGLTRRFFAHVLDLPMAYLLRRRSGELLRSLDFAGASSQIVVSHVVGSLAPALAETAVMAVVLHHLDQPALLMIFAITACLYLVVFVGGAQRIARCARQVSTARLEQQALLTDSLANCEILRCFAAEPAAFAKVDAASRALETSWLRLHRLRTGTAVVLTAIFALSVTASLLLAGSALTNGAITVGAFVLANLYMVQLVRPLELLGGAVRDIAQAVGFAQAMLDVLAEPTEPAEPAAAPVTEPSHTKALPTGTPWSVRFDGVVFGYDADRPVIRGLDLDIAAGQTVAIVGASGSGKSSLVRLLLRLYRPQSGRILLDGIPINTLPASELRSSIGLVPQDTTLFHDTIAGNICLGRPEATQDEIARAAGSAQLHPLISAQPDDYATPVGERGLQLSGGERQRITIARALLKQPAVFVFDEATSMLDSHTEAILLSDIRAWTGGRTTIVIAHRLSTVVHADDIVVLDAGRIAERGRHADLIGRDGLYARMWLQQTGGAT